MKEKAKYLLIVVLWGLCSQSASADVIMESDYYGNTPLSHLAQAAITLIVLGSAVLAIVAILIIFRHRKEDEKMEQERREAEKEEEKIHY